MNTIDQNPSKQKHKKQTVNAQDTATFCLQTSMVLKAGIPLYDGISTIRESAQNKEADAVLAQIETRVKETGSLYTALSEADVFPSHMVNMVQIGERVGKLDSVMESLAEYYEREFSIKQSVRHAIFYPIVLIMMVLAVIGVLVWRVLPIFQQIFDSLGNDVSSNAQLLMNMGASAAKWALVLIVLLIVTTLCLWLFSRTQKGFEKLQKAAGNFILTRKLFYKIAAGRFASVMAMLLKSGYHLEDALELVPTVISNPLIDDKIRQCRELMKDGKTFSQALQQTRLYTGMPAQLLTLGFQTGNADTAMDKVASLYENEIHDSVNSLVSAIEPTLVAILSIITGVILLSVMLPLMSIMNSIS